MCDGIKRRMACVLTAFPALAGAGFLLACFGAQGQSLAETEGQFLSGHYDAVIETTRSKLDGDEYVDGWRVLLVKSLLTVGRYAEARSNALAGVEALPGSMQLRLLARETDLEQNDVAGANEQLNEIKELIEGRGRFEQSGENLVAIGTALLLLGVEPRVVLE